MTTIAYRAGVMAADTRAYAGYNAPLGSKNKLLRMPDGTLVGVSSSKPGFSEFVTTWFVSGADLKDVAHLKDVEFTLIAVRADGSAIYAKDDFYLSGPVTAPFYSIGSGNMIAIGAMHIGASAHEAVEAACHYDVWSSGPVMSIRHTEG